MFKVKVLIDTLLRDESGKKVEVKKNEILSTDNYELFLSWMQYSSFGRIIEIKMLDEPTKEVKEVKEVISKPIETKKVETKKTNTKKSTKKKTKKTK